ncbi:hypothetical protein [Kitasatospora aureofaciens]|uniref:hypothetical protein n=1 Tax=Kitasatospora aureofaciens TaxID=1894 RepID=UPI00340E2C0B
MSKQELDNTGPTTNTAQPWRAYEQVMEGESVVTDLASELRRHTGVQEPRDPDQLVSLAIVGAETTEALARQLEAEWTLYTPQQVGVVASALCAQIDAASTGLERLRDVLAVIEQRGETTGTGAARELLLAAADGTRAAKVNDRQLIETLNALPYLGVLPTNAHETIAAVADLLGHAVTLNATHHIEDPERLADRFDEGLGCGCQIKLTDVYGEAWSFHRGDSVWALYRESDGKPTGDGGVVFTNWTELETPDATAHPAHLVAQIRQNIAF